MALSEVVGTIVLNGDDKEEAAHDSLVGCLFYSLWRYLACTMVYNIH